MRVGALVLAEVAYPASRILRHAQTAYAQAQGAARKAGGGPMRERLAHPIQCDRRLFCRRGT